MRHKMPFKPSNNLPHFHLSHFLNFSQRLLGFYEITSIKLTCEKSRWDCLASTVERIVKMREGDRTRNSTLNVIHFIYYISRSYFILSCVWVLVVGMMEEEQLFRYMQTESLSSSFIYVYTKQPNGSTQKSVNENVVVIVGAAIVPSLPL